MKLEAEYLSEQRVVHVPELYLGPHPSLTGSLVSAAINQAIRLSQLGIRFKVQLEYRVVWNFNPLPKFDETTGVSPDLEAKLKDTIGRYPKGYYHYGLLFGLEVMRSYGELLVGIARRYPANALPERVISVVNLPRTYRFEDHELPTLYEPSLGRKELKLVSFDPREWEEAASC